MSNKRVKSFIREHSHKVTNDNNGSKATDTPYILTFGDLIGDAYFTQPIGRNQRFLLKSSVFYLAEKKRLKPATLNASVKRFLKIKKIDEMNMEQFEKALDFLVSQDH